ncbi:MAG: zinc ABC transporter substrate-binding protein [Natronomonas sp.]
MNVTRRSVLRATAGAAGGSVLAGCLGDASEGNDGYGAFFTLWDWANEVGGDAFGFETPVSAGQMGHGWSPDGNITRDIASTEMFIYLDTPEFSWAQDVAAELQRDYENVAVVDCLDGLGPHLLSFDSQSLPDPDRGREYPIDSLRVEEFDIFDLRSEQQLGYWHTDHWHGGIPDVPIDGHVPVGVVLEDDDGHVVPLGENETYQVDARTTDDGIVDVEAHGPVVEFHGRSLGQTGVVFQFRRGDEVIYETDGDPATVSVLEDVEGSAGEFHDPHVWVDPVLGQQMVETIATELAAVDPDNAEVYEENAADYTDRMESVHEEFEELSREAELDVAVFAGHDSFRYLERRYGFDLHTPVGISPNAAESFEDISNTIEVVERHGIDTVLYDPFEAPDPDNDVPQMVEVLFENTDIDNAEPLSPAEGTTRTWQESGWGWVEQMEQINLPSLRIALRA